MSYNLTFSRYYEELLKEAEETLAKEEKFNRGEGYSYEIVLVPTAVVFNEEGIPGIIYHPKNELIRK